MQHVWMNDTVLLGQPEPEEAHQAAATLQGTPMSYLRGMSQGEWQGLGRRGTVSPLPGAMVWYAEGVPKSD